ncbi:hypothetical protein Droror1_Dr00024380 [Drosera rotundifolia]
MDDSVITLERILKKHDESLRNNKRKREDQRTSRNGSFQSGGDSGSKFHKSSEENSTSMIRDSTTSHVSNGASNMGQIETNSGVQCLKIPWLCAGNMVEGPLC